MIIVYPKLHKQALRKAKLAYVKETLNRKPFVDGLTYRCFEGLKAFLGINLTTLDTPSMSQWHENLQKVFDTALQLDLLVSLLGPDIRFEWPRFGAPLDTTSMTVHGERAFGRSGTVRAALFPCLLKEGKSHQREECMLHALVILI